MPYQQVFFTLLSIKLLLIAVCENIDKFITTPNVHSIYYH